MYKITWRKKITTLLLVLGLAVTGCGSNGAEPDPVTPPATSARFAVFSDPHLYDSAALGGVSNGTVTSRELAEYLAIETTMLVESGEILSTILNDLKSRDLDFVIVSGDLTKDGELVNHRLMADRLAGLKAAGMKVYVIPGNHDINNPDALSYRTSPPSPVAGVTPADFKQIYADFGYNDAIARDPSSLSYVAEPVPGLWLFALDSCRYDDNIDLGFPVIAGALRPDTLSWVLDRLAAARLQGKTVIGMMHHGILEHFTGQAALFSEFVLDDSLNIARTLSDNGLNVIFTGHFHANDIIRRDFGSSVLHDIETGSSLTAPSPYRIVDFDIAGGKMAITTSRVAAIESHPADFQEYSRRYLNDNLTAITPVMLAGALTPSQVSSLTPFLPLIVNGLVAHYAGDETPDEQTRAAYTGMINSESLLTRIVGQDIAALWTDQAPADNHGTITINAPD